MEVKPLCSSPDLRENSVTGDVAVRLGPGLQKIVSEFRVVHPLEALLESTPRDHGRHADPIMDDIQILRLPTDATFRLLS